MAPRTSKATVEADEVLDDEAWAKLQTENYIPPLEYPAMGLTFLEPTKRQVDAWRKATTVEEGERALWGDALYEQVHAVFDELPEHVWENFNVEYLKHFFGTTGDDSLKS